MFCSRDVGPVVSYWFQVFFFASNHHPVFASALVSEMLAEISNKSQAMVSWPLAAWWLSKFSKMYMSASVRASAAVQVALLFFRELVPWAWRVAWQDGELRSGSL